MKTKWLIQSSGFYTSTLIDVIASLKELDIPFNDFGIIDNTITNLENILEKDYKFITRGGVKLINLLNQKNINLKLFNDSISDDQNNDVYLNRLLESIDYNIQTFDQEYYNTLDLPLLNKNAQFKKFKEIKDIKFNTSMFVKPSQDTKIFNGGILNTLDTLSNYVTCTGFSTSNIDDKTIVISPLKNIYSEYRFFMYNDIILGCSRYILNGKVNPNTFVPKEFKDFAKECSIIYKPKDLYVIDIADTDKGLKIVEYNCWNCSGFYQANIKDIIYTINQIKGIN